MTCELQKSLNGVKLWVSGEHYFNVIQMDLKQLNSCHLKRPFTQKLHECKFELVNARAWHAFMRHVKSACNTLLKILPVKCVIWRNFHSVIWNREWCYGEKISSAKNWTRINCLEGSYADQYTTDADTLRSWLIDSLTQSNCRGYSSVVEQSAAVRYVHGSNPCVPW